MKYIFKRIFHIILLSSCSLSDETKTLSGGWVLAFESKHDVVIDEGARFVPCQVMKYGYDDNFIVAEQKPTEECFRGKDTNSYPDMQSTYYWIVDHKNHSFFGPLSFSEYESKRKELGIPTTLELNPI